MQSKTIELNEPQCCKSIEDLNDDCLWVIFKFLNIETLCDLADVCKRFQEIASFIFHRYHANIKFSSVNYQTSLFRRILCKFGHLIKAIEANQYIEIDIDAITKYCNANLQHLQLSNVTIDCNSMGSLFGYLKCLYLSDCQFNGNVEKLFGNCLLLEKVYFSTDKKMCDFFMVQKFPKLKEFTLNCPSIEYCTFSQFLAENSQLLKFNVNVWPVDRCDSDIIEPTQNLEISSIHLRCMDTFANANFQIERSTQIDSLVVQNILQLKTITKLDLDFTGRISESDLISLVSELPLLTEFQYGNSSLFKCTDLPWITLTADCLVKLVERGLRLEYVCLVAVERLHIDQNVFRSLLSAMQSGESKRKLNIAILGHTLATSFNVPQCMIQLNREQLEIWFNDVSADYEIDN